MPQLTLQSPNRSRERILVMGHEGGGKSSNILYLADRCPDATFWIVDTDRSYERLIETDHSNLTNIRLGGYEYEGWGELCFGKDLNVHEWEGQVALIKEAQGQMGYDDWLIIDLEDKLWETVQEYFIEKVFGGDIDAYFMQTRLMIEHSKKSNSEDKEKKTLGALEGWKDWPVINKIYHQHVSKPLLQSPGHLYIVTGAQSLSEKNEDKGIKELYGALGTKPKGQKGTGHLMQTVLFQTYNPRNDQRKLETVKDRGRAMWRGEVFEDFVEDYFIGTAGWVKKVVM